MTAVKKTDGKRKVGDGTPGPGRPPGAQNKTGKALKEMILGALDDAGGQKYLLQQSKDNPKAFVTLLGRLIPLDVAVSADAATVEAFLAAEKRRRDAR